MSYLKRSLGRLLDFYLMKRNQIRVNLMPPRNIIELIYRLNPIRIDKELIRLGPEKDGGYLVPDDLLDIEACFSPGVFKISKFEYDCFNRGMKLFLADKSIQKPEINIPNDKYEFISKFIGSTDNMEFITMDTWVRESSVDNDSDLFLQMDIEGWEYLSIISTSNSLLKRFRIMVIEFHNLHHLWNPEFFSLANQVFEKILVTHSCVHIHPNNDSPVHTFNGLEIPPLLEFTFYRNDRLGSYITLENQFPNKLDCNNVPQNKTITLPTLWYKTSIEN